MRINHDRTASNRTKLRVDVYEVQLPVPIEWLTNGFFCNHLPHWIWPPIFLSRGFSFPLFFVLCVVVFGIVDAWGLFFFGISVGALASYGFLFEYTSRLCESLKHHFFVVVSIVRYAIPIFPASPSSISL